MSDLSSLYHDLILDHGRAPRNFGSLPEANLIKQGFNPLCGDKLTFYIVEHNQIVEKMSFEGTGCAISMASASLLTEFLIGKTIAEMEHMFDIFHQLIITGKVDGQQQDALGKLFALGGVSAFPMRVKCATLAWHTVRGALRQDDHAISTE